MVETTIARKEVDQVRRKAIQRGQDTVQRYTQTQTVSLASLEFELALLDRSRFWRWSAGVTGGKLGWCWIVLLGGPKIVGTVQQL